MDKYFVLIQPPRRGGRAHRRLRLPARCFCVQVSLVALHWESITRHKPVRRPARKLKQERKSERQRKTQQRMEN